MGWGDFSHARGFKKSLGYNFGQYKAPLIWPFATPLLRPIFSPMNPIAGLMFKLLRLLALVGACAGSAVHADAYSDASRLMQDNKLAEALQAVDVFLADKPQDPRMQFLKGLIFRKQDKPAQAVAVFTKLTQDFPELPEPYNNLAVLYASQGRFDKARWALETAIRNHPGYATAHENLGDVYAMLARQSYARALEIDAGNAALQPKMAGIAAVLQPVGPASAAKQ